MNETTEIQFKGEIRQRLMSLVDFWGRFKRNKGAVIGCIIVAAFVGVAIIGPVLYPYGPYEGSLEDRMKPPCLSHPLGTDEIGRDVLSRIITGAGISLEIMLASVLIALFIGTFLGALGGYYGGVVDNIVTGLMDIMLAFPSIFLAIAIVAILGPGLFNVMLAAGIYSVPQYARISRASVLYLKERDFVEAARAAGESGAAIIFHHILPNATAPLIIQTSLRMATVLLTAAGLSFLGLGVQPPSPEWGAMLSNGRVYVMIAPHVATFPGMAIMLVVIGFNLLGDGLRDTLDPRLRD
jgi:peptide/nickel transport system permease protein